MKCPTCDNNTPDEAQFCGSCGASLATSTDSGARPVVGELPMISFPDAVRRGFNLYSDFTGRATRAEYWWWTLFFVISFFALRILEAIPGIPAGILGLCFLLATIIPALAVGARRLHDINRTGWWLILGVVPFFGLIALWVLAIYRGYEGPNRYGPDPRRAID